jgi:hypothetical protein
MPTDNHYRLYQGLQRIDIKSILYLLSHLQRVQYFFRYVEVGIYILDVVIILERLY